MTDNQYNVCVHEAQTYTSRDAYISDMSLSSIWDDDVDADIPAERVAEIGAIYDAVHRNVRDIASAAGLSARKLAERFCIPYRTVENWCATSKTEQRSCPIHVRLMMQECLGLLKR